MCFDTLESKSFIGLLGYDTIEIKKLVKVYLYSFREMPRLTQPSSSLSNSPSVADMMDVARPGKEEVCY